MSYRLRSDADDIVVLPEQAYALDVWVEGMPVVLDLWEGGGTRFLEHRSDQALTGPSDRRYMSLSVGFRQP